MNSRIAAAVGALVVGAIGGSATTIALTNGAHESIVLSVGDTIQPRFSIRTDSVLAVVGSRIAVHGCGTGFVFFRNWKGPAQISADSVQVSVPCPSASVASVQICLSPDTAAMRRFAVSPDTTIDPALVPCHDTSAAQLFQNRLAFAPRDAR